jgi:hypothetical protein
MPDPGWLVGFGADGDSLITLDLGPGRRGRRGPVRVRDIATGRERSAFLSSADWITTTRLSPDQRWLVLGLTPDVSRPAALCVLDTADGSVTPLPGAARPKERSTLTNDEAQFSADGRLLAYPTADASDRAAVRVYDLARRREALTADAGTPFALAPHGRALAALLPAESPDSATVGVWDLPSGRRRTTVHVGPGSVDAVVFSPDGAALAVSSHTESYPFRQLPLRLWRSNGGGELPQPPGPAAFVIDTDGRLWAMQADGAGRAAVDFSVEGVRERWLIPRHLVLYSPAPSGRAALVCASYPPPWPVAWGVRAGLLPANWWEERLARGRLWDTAGGRELGLIGPALGAAWSPDARLIATQDLGGMCRQIEVWDVPPNKPLAPFVLAAVLLALLLGRLARRRVRRLPCRVQRAGA